METEGVVGHEQMNKLHVRCKNDEQEKNHDVESDLHSEREHDHTNDSDKHCPTCHCDGSQKETIYQHDKHDKHQSLPPPLPEPKYSFHKRVLPSHLIAISSPRGRQMLLEALSASSDADSPYWSLSEHFQNQSEPSFCGVTTLVMILNSMSVDPQIRWRGGWRYFGNEDVLLSKCCISSERIRRVGITMDEFKQLAQCQGLKVHMKRPKEIEEFRSDLMSACLNTHGDSSATKLVCSFSRAALGQTGDGHFSPIAAYHEPSDSALVMDVARFKYPPYWVKVHDLFEAMRPIDDATFEARGWFLLSDPPQTQTFKNSMNNSNDVEQSDHQLPANLVPSVGQPDICPMGKIKVQFCKAASQMTPYRNVMS